MDSYGRSECHPGTRISLIEFISGWAFDPTSKHNVLWLHSVTGAGKSTLATTIANRFDEMGSGHLGAFLFFDRGVAERNDPANVIRTLAYQLSSTYPSVREVIATVLDVSTRICSASPRLQFQRLLVEPLTTGFQGWDTTILLVLDALDECGTAKSREALLEILAEQTSLLPSYIRILITSRPEHDIRSAFEAQEHILTHELNIMADDNEADIAAYLDYRMMRIQKKSLLLMLGTRWPSVEDMQQLTARASGLFVWASTAAEFIAGYNPRKRMDSLLRGDTITSAENALDALYRTALESVDFWDDEDFVSDFRAVIGLTLAARQPLSSASIDVLLCSSPCHSISHLACLVQQKPTVRLLHPSFADFLLAPSRNLREIWTFHLAIENRSLAIHCLSHLCKVLRRNMCDMTLSSSLDKESLPEDVAYACSFWIDHVCALTGDVATVVEQLDSFLFEHLLHWFEAMSILRKSRDVIKLLNDLHGWALVNCPSQSDLLELLSDANKIAQVFAQSLEEHPLLVYYTVLPFTPTSSLIYKKFHDTNNFPVVSGFYQSWSPVLLILAGHHDGVNSAVFSPNGSQIVSGSDDNTVHLWDAESGADVFLALRGHDDWVSSVAFSPDGSQIVSGSYDETIRLWNTTSGVEVLPVLRGHEDWVSSVTFSPDGTKIASGSGDSTIRVWNSKTATEVLPALRGHGSSVLSIAFSPDGTRIASGSHDNTVRIWDVAEGVEILSAMRGHDDAVSSVAFSPDGNRIISGSYDETVRVWDVELGVEVLPPLRGHEYPISSVVYSRDGSRIVAALGNHTICIWDAVSGEEIPSALEGHEDAVLSVAFSPDGSRIVTASHDNTVRVWKAESSIQKISTLRKHERAVLSVAISPDGTRIVSGSYDTTVRVWDSHEPIELLPALRGHKGWISSVEFSPDGSEIWAFSGSSDAKVWDGNSGALLDPGTSRREHDPDSTDSITKSPARSLLSRLNGLATHAEVLSGWFVHRTTKRTLMKLPTLIDLQCSAEQENLFVVGTKGGMVITIHFPDSLLTSPETRPIERRLLLRSPSATSSHFNPKLGMPRLSSYSSHELARDSKGDIR